MTNHIFPACEAMTSPTRADRDLCVNALCSSSEIALILRAVVEAVCIPPCYSGMHGRAKIVVARRYSLAWQPPLCCRLRAKRKTAHQDITALAIELQLPQPDITVLAMCRLRRTRPRWGCPVRY